jgi:hypothetical protein
MTLLPRAVFAEGEKVISSPAGVIKLVDAGIFDKKILINGKKLNLRHYPIELFAVVDGPTANKFKHHYLITLVTGGSACPTRFRWLDASGNGFHLTEAFGTCAESGSPVSTEDGLAVIQMSGSRNSGQIQYAYDGKKVQKTILGFTQPAPVENPYDPLAWVGQHPRDYVNSKEIESILLDMMSWKDLAHLRAVTELAGEEDKFKRSGQFVIGYGCQPSYCNTNQGLISISLATAEPFLLLRRFSGGAITVRQFGQLPNPVPLEVRRFLEQRSN